MTRPYRRHGRGFYVPDFTPSLQIVAQFSCTCEKLIMKWSKPVTDYLLYMQFIAVVTSLFVCLFTRTLLTLFKKKTITKRNLLQQHLGGWNRWSPTNLRWSYVVSCLYFCPRQMSHLHNIPNRKVHTPMK